MKNWIKKIIWKLSLLRCNDCGGELDSYNGTKWFCVDCDKKYNK